MPDLDTLTIKVPHDLAQDLRAAIDAGEFGSIDEALNSLLSDWQRRRLDARWLQGAVQAGIDSGPGLDADIVFAALRAQFGQPPRA